MRNSAFSTGTYKEGMFHCHLKLLPNIWEISHNQPRGIPTDIFAACENSCSVKVSWNSWGEMNSWWTADEPRILQRCSVSFRSHPWLIDLLHLSGGFCANLKFCGLNPPSLSLVPCPQAFWQRPSASRSRSRLAAVRKTGKHFLKRWNRFVSKWGNTPISSNFWQYLRGTMMKNHG